MNSFDAHKNETIERENYMQNQYVFTQFNYYTPGTKYKGVFSFCPFCSYVCLFVCLSVCTIFFPVKDFSATT